MEGTGLNFVAVGPEKTGTSWLDNALRRFAPETLPIMTKETFYFDRHYHLGPHWHSGLYTPGGLIRGEVAPSYFASGVALERLAQDYPTAKILISLRDPYVRAASHLQHLARRGAFRVDRGAPDVPDEVLAEAIESSRYSVYGRRWLDAFPNGAVLFVSYESLFNSTSEELARICDHFGIDYTLTSEQALVLASEREFESVVPRNPLLARAIYLLSRSLQSIGAVDLVSSVRRSPLRSLVERKGASLPEVREKLVQAVVAACDFSSDVDFAEEVCGREFGSWRKA